MKIFAALILSSVLLGSTAGLGFAEVSVSVPKKIFQNQELLVTVTDAKSQYVTAVFYDLPAKNPETKYGKVNPNGDIRLSHSTKTLTLPSTFHMQYPQSEASIKTVVYVDGEKLEFLTKIVHIR